MSCDGLEVEAEAEDDGLGGFVLGRCRVMDWRWRQRQKMMD